MKKPVLPPSFRNGAPPRRKPSVEDIKRESHHLHGPLAEELRSDAEHFSEAGRQLLKFHGIYEQDDRDLRKDAKEFQFMTRSRIPGGRLTAAQYLAHDDLASRYANGTIRLTTRQAIQFHGIVKGNLQRTIAELNEALVTTLAACGDVVRNVMCCPAPRENALQRDIEHYADALSTHLLPRTPAYHEIWIDGERINTNGSAAVVDEPLYGKTYLPRKFKIGIAYPGDNCIDVFTQDVGIVAVADGDALAGFNVFAGGGLGMSHNKPATFPRLGDALGFVCPDRLVETVEAIVTVQRDFGDRTNRKHARMKYLIHEWGIERFRSEVESRLGFVIEPPRETPPFELDLHLGWHPQGGDHWYLGLSVENGRIRDEGQLRLRSGIRTIVERFEPEVRITPQQDLILAGFSDGQRSAVDDLLVRYGVPGHGDLSNARKFAMACPALPTCGLALTESERVFPGVIDRLEEEIAQLGLQGEAVTFRMTGCPNGCARPYTADVGFVGRSLDQYSVFIGGRIDGTRLNVLYKDLVPLDSLVDTISPLLRLFRDERLENETFGDFSVRIGVDQLKKRVEEHEYVS